LTAERQRQAWEVKMLALPSRLRKGVPPAVVLLLALPAWGCGDGIARVPIEGTVLIDGAPLRGMTGAVTFIPDKSRGNDSPLRAAGPIDKEGRYMLFTKGKPGVPPGHYKVVVSAVPPGAERDASRLAVHPRYVVEQHTPLEAEVVVESAPGRYDLKLTAR
jgi:hypothetical protein